jgi:Flp pilus assembly protein TadG
MRRRDRSAGQALAEFALIVPILVMAIFGVIDFGRYVYTQNALNEAAREAARAASVSTRPTECAGQTRDVCAQTIASARLVGVIGGTPPATVQCFRVTNTDGGDADTDLDLASVPASSCSTTHLFKVTVTNQFNLLTPIIAQFMGPRTLTGVTQVTVQS